MAENTLASIECDIEQYTKQRDRLIWQVQALDEQLEDLNNERRELQLEAVGLKHGDKLLMNEGTANYYCNALWHVFCMANNKDIGVMIQKCGGVGIVVRSVEVVQRMRQAYLDSVAATEKAGE